MIIPIGVGILTSLAVSVALVRLGQRFPGMGADDPGLGPQKFHEMPVPRLGGLSIVLGAIAAGIACFIAGGFRSPTCLGLLTVLLCCIPAFLAGIAEDFSGRVSALTRLVAAMISATMACLLLGAVLHSVDVAILDLLLGIGFVGIVFTAFSVGGVAHSFNLIDGHNGLSSGTAVIVFSAMAAAASLEGIVLVAMLCAVIGAASMGFFIVNYPRGRIFLGDGGAYLLGTAVGISAVMLVGQSDSVSPWFPLALVMHPVFETIFTIFRRKIINRVPASEPDAFHLHSLVYRRVAPLLIGPETPNYKRWRNSFSALPFLTTSALMAIVAFWIRDSTVWLAVQCAIYAAAYLTAYWWIASVRWRGASRSRQYQADAVL